MPTMISTALPKDALSSPERVCPSLSESWSVAVPSSYTNHNSRAFSRRSGVRSGVAMTYRGQGHDRDKAEGEPEGGIPVEEVREEAEGDEEEEDVDIGAKEKELVRLPPGGLPLGAECGREAPVERLRRLCAIAVLEKGSAVGRGRHVCW